jgi:hypothetical protein
LGTEEGRWEGRRDLQDRYWLLLETVIFINLGLNKILNSNPLITSFALRNETFEEK